MIEQISLIVARSVAVSTSSTLLSALFAVPLALLICLSDFRGKKSVLILMRGMLSIPAVVIGLCCYLFFSRMGPLGPLGLLYTPRAMILAQAALAFPIILALTHSAMESDLGPLVDTLRTLGAEPLQLLASVLFEKRRQVLTALIMAFSRVVGETGMTMMVGGNIKGATRVMTTTIALETMKGNFELAVWLGVILFAVAVLLNVLLHVLVGESRAFAM